MGKIYIEDKKISTNEKISEHEAEHAFKGDKYVLKTVQTLEFQSCIYSYEDTGEMILVSKIEFFNEDYYKFVLFCDNNTKAWPLIELPAALDIQVKRLSNTMFFVVGDNKTDSGKLMSQVAFCRIKPSEKVEYVTLSFKKLVRVEYDLNKLTIVFQDACDANTVSETTSEYNFEGKLLKTDTVKVAVPAGGTKAQKVAASAPPVVEEVPLPMPEEIPQ